MNVESKHITFRKLHVCVSFSKENVKLVHILVNNGYANFI